MKRRAERKVGSSVVDSTQLHFLSLRNTIACGESTEFKFHFKIALKEISHTEGKLVFWAIVFLKIT